MSTASQKRAFGPEQEPKEPALRPIHGLSFRQEEAIPVGQLFRPGRFGRIFPLPMRTPVSAEAIQELAKSMIDTDDAASSDNQAIPAAYTYLGQFIDHDMTLDTTPMPEQIVDPQMIHNFRTPALDLDSLYGLGPAAQPYLYQAKNPAKFLLGKNADSTDQNNQPITLPEGGTFDLPRNAEGFATIGDPRNDENIIVAQLHLAFLKFHNAVADQVEPDAAKQGGAFNEIRRVVTWHYQWIVIHDFLRRSIREDVLDDVLENGREFYLFEQDPFIPVEFSVAAYRFGHTMVRNNYDHNRVFGPGPAPRKGPGSLALLFFFTGPRRERGALASAPLPSNWIIDWRRFLDVDPGFTMTNLSRSIDTHLSTALHDLIANTRVGAPPTSLAERNLKRGEMVALPTGQNVAALMRIPCLTPEEIASSGPDGEVAAKHGLHKQTPLWYYILKEAQIQENGVRLGALGSRILAEVFVGLLEGDPLSYLSSNPLWKPQLGDVEGQFTLSDMLRFVEKNAPILNPIGN